MNFISSTYQKPTLVRILWRNKEFFIWIAALVMLYTADLHSDFTLCVPTHLGWNNCPGCGVGHAMTAAMHGDFSLSWQYHKLGIIALIALGIHIIRLGKKINNEIREYYGK